MLSQEGQQWVTLIAGRNCTQEMVDMNLLRYMHTGLHGARTQDMFVFYLLDGKNLSPPQHFHISVKDLEKGTKIQSSFLPYSFRSNVLMLILT